MYKFRARCQDSPAASTRSKSKRLRSSSSSASGAAEAASATAAASHFDRLPPGICQELAEFLPSSGGLTALLATSKGTRRLVEPGVREWRMEDRRQDPDDTFDAAAIGALERSPDMRSFSVKRVDWRPFTAHSPFLRRLGHDAAFGERLRSLRLASVKPAGLHSLAKCLAGGRLPCLTELEVVMVSAWESDRARQEKERAWAALPRALEKRARLGLAPLTSIKGAAKRAPKTLARLWACCPPERVTYLEARGVKQVRALGAFLRAHPGFAALRTLHVSGQEDRFMEGDAGEYEPPAAVAPWRRDRGDGAGVWEALAQGHCPALETLVVDGSWSDERESVAALGKAVKNGRLPRLVELVLDMSTVYDWDALIEGLASARGMALKRLVLGRPLCKADAGGGGKLLAALRAGSGVFAQLEELQWPTMLIKELDAPLAPFGAGALRVLAEGAAPCMRTLRSLAVEHVPPEVGRRVLAALAANAFPRLTTLSLEGDWVDNAAVDGLVQALRRLAAWWPGPCRLKELSIEGGGSAYMAHMGQRPGLDTVVAAQQLTPAFVEGALSGLTRLAIRGRAAEEPYPPGAMDWVDNWAAVGPANMRLEALTLRFGEPQPYHLYTRLQEAAADPAFCPHLCKFSFQNWNDFGQPAAAIRERWRVRLARAEAAAAEAAMMQAGVEGLGEYASEFVSLFEEEEGKEEAVVAVVVEEQ